MPEPSTRFSDEERMQLLAISGIGQTTIRRFEEAGVGGFERLARQSAPDLCRIIAHRLGSPCWANNPRVLRSVEAAIETARGGIRPDLA